MLRKQRFERNEDTTIKISAYRKATHTGEYSHYDSNHHGMKVSVAKCLYDRVTMICSDQEELKEKLQK